MLRHDRLGSTARLLAAATVLMGGLVHLQLYFDGYRNLPDANLGRSFVANGVASVAIAGALVMRRDAVVRLAGIGLAVGTLAAFALSRTGDGVFGLRETGLEPSPQAALAVVAELLSVALLAATFAPAVGGGVGVPRLPALALVAAVLLGAGGSSALWARGEGPVAVAQTPGSVAISGFAFDAPALTVPAGTTVTWTNADAFAHSVVAHDGSFRSDSLGTGASFSHDFGSPGEFTYLCGIHPSMAGSIVVTG
ncbi:MAG: cupredoxin domain-containing protein [Actinomycetota bacterium]|nr:cupredoxin domain-containing protein [Actinomycetota bacterium]